MSKPALALDPVRSEGRGPLHAGVEVAARRRPKNLLRTLHNPSHTGSDAASVAESLERSSR